MNNIANNIEKCIQGIPSSVKLVAVSKTKPIEDIQEAYNAGQRIFGENKVQELANKYELLPKDIEWHMIGHLQTNKVKYIAPFVNLIHAVDSFKLLKTINKEALKNKRVINCLLQVYIAKEDTKFGLSYEDLKVLLDSDDYKNLENINLIGVMGMASHTNDKDKIRAEFKNLVSDFNNIKKDYFVNNNEFKEISMGMSGDYNIAIEEGSTMVRLGSVIFGARNCAL